MAVKLHWEIPVERRQPFSGYTCNAVTLWPSCAGVLYKTFPLSIFRTLTQPPLWPRMIKNLSQAQKYSQICSNKDTLAS